MESAQMITDPSYQGASAETIATKTFQYWKRTLKQHGLDTSLLWPQDFQWLLPGPGTTQQQLDIFCALRDHPLSRPNSDLMRIVQLEPSTQNSPPTPPGHHFYIRSWQFTQDQLEKVIRFLCRQDILLSEATHWENTSIIYNNKTQPCTYTIRYVDMVSGPQRPTDRHTKDFAADERAPGVLLEFLAAVEQLFPEVAAAVELHLVKQASVDGFESSSLAEEIKRVLIEYLGHPSLLNRPQGGDYVSFVPFYDDVDLFRKLHTRYFTGFLSGASDIAINPRMTTALSDHFEEIQAFSNSYPSHTGTVQHHFSDGIRKAAMKSAEPMLYHGTAILILLGKGITYEQYLGEKTFFESNARSAYLVHDFLSRLAGTEEINTSPGASWNPKAFNTHHVAFADFWPWLWHSRTTLIDAIRFTQQYLSIVRPLIVATWSRPVTSIVRANFQNEGGMTHGLSLLAVVGEITIQYHGSRDDDDSAFLAIPHIHPGFEKYVDASLHQILLRFMDLTWQMTIHLADEARKLLEEDHAQKITRTRKAHCMEIIERIEHQRASDPDMRAFMQNFRQASEDLRGGWISMHPPPEVEDYRPLPNENGRARIVAIGRAEGHPHSGQRAQQLETLWSQRVDNLSYSGGKYKQKWMDDFLGLERGQQMFPPFRD
ncbi:hypothetical protein D6D26_09806 [Aureobasidium pullulans]|nr:hypothetical protein D6D26_09806 [Aureobasidium pullulans]